MFLLLIIGFIIWLFISAATLTDDARGTIAVNTILLALLTIACFAAVPYIGDKILLVLLWVFHLFIGIPMAMESRK